MDLTIRVPAGVQVASSSGGGIEVSGGVTVSVPRDETLYSVDASSSGGSTRIQVRTDPSGEHRIKARSSGGGVTIRYRDAAG